MKVISKIGEAKKYCRRSSLAIGVFDGLHRGHQKLIRKVISSARRHKGQSVVMTFYPHPVNVLHPEINLPLIISLEHRLKILQEMGVDICFLVRFTKKFSQLSPESFIQKFLTKGVRPVEVFVGDDFRFGQNREGTLELFKDAGQKNGFRVNALTSSFRGTKTTSSTRIRQLITEGSLFEAKKLLNRPPSIMGEVVRGESRGKTLGYPTANIDPDGLVIPPMGVYAVNVFVGNKKYHGMTNIGVRPSFKKHNEVNVEVHLLNFHGNLYGHKIIIEFLKRIRDEKFFNSAPKLIEQLKKDEKTVRSFFSR